MDQNWQTISDSTELQPVKRPTKRWPWAVGIMSAVVLIGIAISAATGSGHNPPSYQAQAAASSASEAPATTAPVQAPQTSLKERVGEWSATNDVAGKASTLASAMGAVSDDANAYDITTMHVDCARLDNDLTTMDGAYPSPDAQLNSIWGNASTVGHRAANECQAGGIDNVPAISASASDMTVFSTYVQQLTARTNEISAM